MIVVTGGAGFIGSNVVHELNRRGREDIIVVDDLSDGHKFLNIAAARFADYLDYAEFRRLFESGAEIAPVLSAIVHLGACSTTTEWDGRMMMDINYAYSRDLIRYCVERETPIVYASSAAVYGGSNAFVEDGDIEKPLNVYGYSKYLVDRFARTSMKSTKTPIVGLRYFNVYGPRESHKGGMASVAYHLNRQLLESGTVKLFEGSHGYANGEQCRDFIYVDDAVNATLWFVEQPDASGVFNCGTGRAEAFNEVARAVMAWHGSGKIEYVPFPENLREAYQSFTQADMSAVRRVGCDMEFRPVADGVRDYLDWLNA